MMIKLYDVYKLELNKFSCVDIDSIKESEQLYYLRLLLLWSFGHIRKEVSNFIREIENSSQDRFLFELVEINFDQKNNEIYLTEGWHEYHNKLRTSEIEELFANDNYIQLCKIGFFDHMVINKDNFIHLLLAWDKILNQVPCFAILYQNDKDWYEVLPFETQEAMEKFVADHTQKE